MKFIGTVLATIIGIFLFCILFFFGILFFTAMGSSSNEVVLKENSVIELNVEKITTDYGGKNNYKEFNYSETNSNGFSNIINAIEEAKTDPNIKGISIINNITSLGMAQTRSLRAKLNEFKETGKFIVAYANTYTQKEYYLNSIADTIYLNPIGELDFKGLASELLFFKDFQNNTGIKMEVIRHGKYKSAVESFLDNKMSDANREQLTTLLNNIWTITVNDISESRTISVDSLNLYANDLLVRTPEMAKSKKLIDKIAYEDEYHNGIKKALGIASNDDYNSITILDYAKKIAHPTKTPDIKEKIAVIYAQGTIKEGTKGSSTEIGEEAMRTSLQLATKDDDIKAIVLRIDSPGGSALVSELIWREIEITKQKKPVIVSMGNVAASGGYYIACNAHKIFADANSITGSIGVFGTLPNLTQLTNKMGIHAQQVKTHKNASGYSIFLPLDETFKSIQQESIERIYTTFVQHVADGRKMTYQQVDDIAQGRIWTGTDALKIGLIDALGTLEDAIKEAASIANITSYKIQDFPEFEKTFDDLLQKIPFIQSKERFIKEEVGEENYLMIQQIRNLNTTKGIQTIMPFEINIH